VAGEWGGARNWKFETQEDEKNASSLMMNYFRDRPTATLQDCVDYAAKRGIFVNVIWVSRLLQRMDYTQKVISHKQKNKFTKENIEYYAEYSSGIRQFPRKG